MGEHILDLTLSNMLIKLLPSILISISAFPTDLDFETWKLQHNKNYQTLSSESKHYQTFTDNRNFVNNHNDRYSNGLESYHVKLNKFADLTNEEFAEKYLTARKTISREEDNFECPTEFVYTKEADGSYPKGLTYAGIFYDEFSGGYSRVTPVKDQGDSCSSSSWAFAAAGAIEGTLCGKQYKNCTSWNGVSSQQQLDCCANSNQCDGGYPTNAMECIIENNGGIENADDYPYTGTISSCAYQANLAITPGITSCGRIMPGNETQMHQMVYQEGPAAVRIDGSGLGFQFYFGGIYVSNLCSATDLNHAMIVTGYGTQTIQYSVQFWECKNSWGAGWGVDGYIFMKRNH